MNITFFIGNGFDLAQGLPTRYEDFYKYLETHEDELAKNPYLRKLFEEKIKHDYKHWSDLEYALGRCTEDYGTENSELFWKIKSELDSALIRYFQSVEQDHQLPVDEIMASEFIRQIRDIYQDFDGPEQEHFQKIIAQSNQWQYRFVTLNYTGYLDRFLETAKALEQKKKGNFQWEFGASPCDFTLPDKALHVHGTVGNDMILGVNGPEQIEGTNLFVTDVVPCMVKQEMNKELKLGRTEKTEALIEESQYVCLFGVSLGETDMRWWEKIMQWLLQDKNRRLVIYKRWPKEGPFSGPGYTAYQKNTEECLDQFLKVSNANQSYKSTIRERCIVVIGSGIFKFDKDQKVPV